MSDKEIAKAHAKELLELRIEELSKRLDIPEDVAASYIIVKIMLETEGLF
jgi:hypothetical protein